MLETEIKKLTASIDRLSELLVAGQSITVTDDGVTPPEPATKATHEPATKATPETPLEEPTKATPKKKAAADVDFDALREKAKGLCLTLVREDRDNKKLISAYLTGYDAKTIAQLADENLDAFIASMLEIQNAK